MEPYCEVLTTGFCSVKMTPDLLIRKRLNKAYALYSARSFCYLSDKLVIAPLSACPVLTDPSQNLLAADDEAVPLEREFERLPKAESNADKGNNQDEGSPVPDND